jgi:hypothetical protein
MNGLRCLDLLVASSPVQIPVGLRHPPPPPTSSQPLANNHAPFSDHEPTLGAVGSVHNSNPGIGTSAQTTHTRPSGPSPIYETHDDPPPWATAHTPRTSPSHDQNSPLAHPSLSNDATNPFSRALSLCGKCLSSGHRRVDCRTQF